MRRRLLRVLLVTGGVAIVFGLVLIAWARTQLNASLPQLEGTRRLPGLAAAVTVTRDALGIPTVRGGSREDVARATGFLHAQDRFFQMDLARRRPAGELSALVGPRALLVDRVIRVHRFRAQAQRAVPLMSPHDRAMLEAYTAGVNTGLSALAAAPFEYLLLRQTPEPWRPEDSLLVVLSMFVTLQETDGAYESTVATMHDVLPAEMVAFLAPRGTEWDSPIVGAAFGVPAVPGPDVYNLRARRAGKPAIERSRRPDVAQLPTPNSRLPKVEIPATLWSALGVGNWELGVDGREPVVGSSNWAIAGRLTSDGGALVANDMHLSVRVPNTWYRAFLEWPDPSDPSEPHRLIGVTLPGVPALVVGSNTHVAWGFTNTYADWSDFVLLEIDRDNPNRYRTPDGWRELERYEEVIKVAGEDDRRESVEWTIWGPVLGTDHRGRLRAYRWVAHSAERLGMTVTPLESARSLEEVFDEANGLGTPGQNMVVADRSGRIGWTVYGSIPRRHGGDGRLPASWSDGSRSWTGWLNREEYPRVVEPAAGRIWTANARVVDGDMLATLGDGNYEVGSRARIIRDRLMAQERFTARDSLELQLDTRADFLARWRDLILRTLTPGVIDGDRDRARFREVVEKDWTGHASPASASYRLTRTFREEVSERVMTFALAECYEADPAFDHTTIRRREGPVWRLVSDRPLHLLDPEYASWQDLLVAAIDAVIEEATRQGDLGERVWSEYNVTAYRHPLSAGLPLVGRWLDMPGQKLAGDLFTLRMHWGATAASQRMVVSPGREVNGIMHMPTGQSGHPLSPFYANSHEAWVKGEATPFLPGPALHTLMLVP
jgi:penicillin G amidase